MQTSSRSRPASAIAAATFLLAGVLLSPFSLPSAASAEPHAALGFLASLESTYETGDTGGFIALLTPEYRFFSPDEGILRRFPDGFARDDERDSHARLFAGGTNSEGRFLPRALAVDVEFLDTQVCPDPEYPGDAAHAVIHVRRACLAIRFADGTAMRDEAPHAFWVVETPEGWRCRRWVERPISEEPLLATAVPTGNTERRAPDFPGPLAAGAAATFVAVAGVRRRKV